MTIPDLSAFNNRSRITGANIAWRRVLKDPGSCEVPEGETITLEEWKEQNEILPTSLGQTE